MSVLYDEFRKLVQDVKTTARSHRSDLRKLRKNFQADQLKKLEPLRKKHAAGERELESLDEGSKAYDRLDDALSDLSTALDELEQGIEDSYNPDGDFGEDSFDELLGE